MPYPLSITLSPHESYQMGNGICGIVILTTHLCLEGGKNQTEKHMTSPLSLVWFRMTQSGGQSASMRLLAAAGPPASLT